MLEDDSWDDFGFRTSFKLSYYDKSGRRFEIGLVKIAQLGMTEGRVALESDFTKLGPDFCSLGQNQSYYETVQLLPVVTRRAILQGMNDIVWNPSIQKTFDLDAAFATSLLRSVSPSSFEKFRSVLEERAERTAFSFNYKLPEPHEAVLTFAATPSSHPPTNIHVLIGSNGVGKTRLLRNLATLMRSHQNDQVGKLGSLTFSPSSSNDGPSKIGFANLITVAFSAFDPFTPDEANSASGFNRGRFKLKEIYIGLKKAGPQFQLKTPSELQKDFLQSTLTCIESSNRGNWLDAIRVLESDSVLAEMRLSEIAQMDERQATASLESAFQGASSGHRLVLSSISQLVSQVGERSLVLIDEPETHLHPPLQSAFIRALSELLAKRNGIAIMATHSPVMLQEVPRDCVWMLYRNGEKLSASRPDIETFAENVGVLTREVFRLEVTQSGFHAMLKASLANAETYEEILGAFSGKVGTEGRALIRALLRSR